MRYAVTGAAGFIGSHLAEALLAAGHDVIGIDCLTDYYDPALKEENARGLELQRLDLAVDELDFAGLDAVFHLAGQPGVRSFGDVFPLYLRRNVLASQRVFEAAAREGVRVIYAAEHYSTALLEKLVHLNFILPKAMHWISISIPAGTSYETFLAHAHPGWDGVSEHICKVFGDAWIKSGRSALLFVPSIPARLDRNVLINRAHPEARRFTHARPEPVPWDARLFTPSGAAPSP